MVAIFKLSNRHTVFDDDDVRFVNGTGDVAGGTFTILSMHPCFNR